jgi:ribosomal protein S14
MKNQQLKDQKRRSNFSKTENDFFIVKGAKFLSNSTNIKTKFLIQNNICRVKNRCIVSMRDRAVFRDFKLTRGILRQHLSFGKIPGFSKSSW